MQKDITFESLEVKPRLLLYQTDNFDMLKEYLEFRGFLVDIAYEDDIFDKIRAFDFDCCLFDHYRSTRESFRLRPLKFLRSLNKEIPALILSSRDDSSYAVEALKEGATDYIAKPYNAEELVCRLRNAIPGFSLGTHRVKPVYTIGDYIFEVSPRRLTIGDYVFNLSTQQAQMLAVLCSFKGKYLPLSVIKANIFSRTDSTSSVNCNLSALRSCLKRDTRVRIEHKRNLGYRLMVDDDIDNLM